MYLCLFLFCYEFKWLYVFLFFFIFENTEDIKIYWNLEKNKKENMKHLQYVCKLLKLNKIKIYIFDIRLYTYFVSFSKEERPHFCFNLRHSLTCHFVRQSVRLSGSNRNLIVIVKCLWLLKFSLFLYFS